MSATPRITSQPRLIRIADVVHITSLARSTIYALMQAGRFPERVRISPSAVRWHEGEVRQWVHDRLAQRRDGSGT